MEYNTSRKKLDMPEYGRHVYRMVQHAMQIEDREQRNVAAQTIIGVMGSLMPSLRDAPDFKHKLWDHLHIISGFKLDIDAPYPPPLDSEMTQKPAIVPYPQSSIHAKHYGKVLVKMIREAGKLNNCSQKDSLIMLLAAQMKKSYTAWNRNEINNEQIIQDMWDISNGTIRLRPEMMQFTSEPSPRERDRDRDRDRDSSRQSSHGGFAQKRKRKIVGRK
jgi:hypothetical protein